MGVVEEDDRQTENPWELTVTDELRAPVDKVWDLVSDFVNIHRWLPGVTSTLSAGEAQVPGAVRLVKSKEFPTYAYEKLVSLDSDNHSMVYEVQDNNLKLIDYKGELSLTNGSEPGSTSIAWGFKMSTDSDKGVVGLLGSHFRTGIQALKAILEEAIVEEAASAVPVPEEEKPAGNGLPEAPGDGSKLPTTTEGPAQPLRLNAEEPLLTSEVEKLCIAT